MLKAPNFLESIKKKKFFRRLLCRPLSIVGIDIGSSFIKVAEISFVEKKPLMKAAGIIGIPDGIIEDGRILNIRALSALLKKLWVDSALTCFDVSAAVGGRFVLVREAVFPAMSSEELEIAIKWDIGKYVPYEENSYYYDFAILDVNDAFGGEFDEQSRVLLVASPIKTVNDIVDALKEAHLKVWAVDVEPLAMAETLDVSFEEANIIVDIGCFQTQIIIFSGHVPSFSEKISWGGQKFTELIMEEFGLEFDEAEKFKLSQNEDLIELKIEPELKLEKEEIWQKQYRLEKQFKRLSGELSSEISRVINNYFSKNPQANIEKIYLIGGGANLKGLSADIEAEFKKIPVSVHNPLSGLDISHDIDQNYINKAAPQLTVAIGLALRGGQI